MPNKTWTLDAIIEECRKYEWIIMLDGAIRTDPYQNETCPRGILPNAVDPLPPLGDDTPNEDPRTSDLVTCAADNLTADEAGDHDPPITDSEIQAVRKRLIDELGAKEVE